MQLDIHRTLWGVTDDWSQIVTELSEAGCVGIEARVPLEDMSRRQLQQRLQADQLGYIAILFSGGDVIPDQSEGPEQHLQRLQSMLPKAAELEPQLVNILPGNDRWSLSMQVDFFGAAMELAQQAGVRCLFETHRATSLYSPWLTLELLAQLPDMRFTADISHWVLVAERLLDCEQDWQAMQPFIDRVDHIQARAGYAQGPQLPHPAAPEYAAELAFFEAFWQRVWASQQARGFSKTTLTPEFGRDGYLHHLPFTDVPVADLWQLNAWMAKRQRKQFDLWAADAAC